MALQINLDHESGLNLPQAYARIAGINLSHTHVSVYVEIWANAQTRADGKKPMKDFAMNLDPVDSVSLSAVYTLLKTLPEFAGALDV